VVYNIFPSLPNVDRKTAQNTLDNSIIITNLGYKLYNNIRCTYIPYNQFNQKK